MEFTSAEISAYYSARMPNMPQPDHREWRSGCPVHGGKDLNFAVESSTGQAFCHSVCGRGFDILSLEMELTGADFVKAKAEIFRLIGRPPERYEDRDIQATYDYTDENGNLLYQVVRKVGKKFAQRRKVESGKWVWSIAKVTPVPFKLPELTGSWDGVIAVAEGEKDVISLMRAGWTATCNNGGAGNFKEALAPWFAGKHIAIFPDNDEPGRKHAESVAKILHPVAASIKIVELQGLPLKGDVSDFLATGKTGDDLYALYEAAQEWTPDWKYASDLPHENDKYLRTFGQYVSEVGGESAFWKAVEIEGLPTPFDSLTKSLGGLRQGEVYVIAANQGAGKTSMALQFAIAALEGRKGVLIFSMEMAHREVFQRIAAIDARVDLSNFRHLRKFGTDPIELTQIEERLAEATKKFSNSPLFVSTKSSVTTDYLVEESKRVQARKKIELVIVDHMQLMGSTGKPRSDYEKFTAISRATKGIAAELNVPLVLVSQTSRVNSTDKRFELEVSDIRGSGAIEEDAAGVMLIYYDSADFKTAKEQGDQTRMKKGPLDAWLKLGKNRYGEQGTHTPLKHYKAETRFTERFV